MAAMSFKTLKLAGAAAGVAVLVTGLIAVAPSPAPGAPLDTETCEQLKREVGDLDRIGARNNMTKGAAWGKANLNGAQLEQVKKLIEIEEAIAFRCPKPKPLVEQAAVAPGSGKPKVKAAAKPKTVAAGGVVEGASAAAAKPKPAPAKRAAEAGAAQPAAPAVAKPRPKRPAEPTSDAYSPPIKAQ